MTQEEQEQYQFQWIGSDGWADRVDAVEGVEDFAKGSLSLRIYAVTMRDFNEHFLSLNADNHMRRAKQERYEWFLEFWEERFHCCLRTMNRTCREGYTATCDTTQNITSGGHEYAPDAKLLHVRNAIYTVALGLDEMQKSICQNPGEICANMSSKTPPNKINGTILLEHMLAVRFNDAGGQEMYFDENGDPPARYDIMNYQGKAIGYVDVGDIFSSSNQDSNDTESTVSVNLEIDRLMWHHQKNETPLSYCSNPCSIGFEKNYDESGCCWSCVQCKPNQFVSLENKCKNCPLGQWPIDNRSSCVVMPLEYLTWTEPIAVLAAVFSSLGILVTAGTMTVFLLHNSTPVVKATTRELSYIILVGIYICYGMTFVIISRPALATCYILRIAPGIAFAMIYGALLTKTNRIARILAGQKRIRVKKARFLDATSQVVITLLLVSVEIAIVAAMLIYENPVVLRDYRSEQGRAFLMCRPSTIAFLAPFGWDLFLICLCTFYAVGTRNIPENFNEAKFIGFTMYTTCIIWLAFLVIYFGSPNKSITMCLSFSLSATVSLVLLFFPKVYIIVFQPEKNVRSSFTTTKVIRCHFGTPSNASTGDTQARVPANKKSCPAGLNASVIGSLPWLFSNSCLVSYCFLQEYIRRVESNAC